MRGWSGRLRAAALITARRLFCSRKKYLPLGFRLTLFMLLPRPGAAGASSGRASAHLLARPRRRGGAGSGYASRFASWRETRDAIAMMVIIGFTPRELGRSEPSAT